VPTVLVVEDNPITRKMFVTALQAGGYATLEAPDGRTALALVEQGPDLILQDLLLPDWDGVELAAELRRRSTTEVPVLCCTGFLPRVE
jgi:CheY-like chemotaxis protein